MDLKGNLDESCQAIREKNRKKYRLSIIERSETSISSFL